MRRSTPKLYAGSSAELQVSFFDKQAAAAAPSGVTYRIIEPSTAEQIRASSSLSPAAVVDIPLRPADNQLSEGHDQERRRVIVNATFGADDVLVDVFEYLIQAAD